MLNQSSMATSGSDPHKIHTDVTVLLCTYSRCELLKKALESVAASEMPSPISWEVVVVDNNSNDRTKEVTEEFVRRYPGRFRYQFEGRAGKSYALNSGVENSRGDVIAFMDDDVVVDPSWLYNLTRPLEAEYVGSGGRILPNWTSPPPAWLPKRQRYALAPLAAFDLGLQPGALEEPPFGTNMAFRKSAFAKHGGFRTDLGPRPKNEMKNEDTEFGARLLAAGERLAYVPTAVVLHVVPENRLKKRYFLNWWFDKSRSEIRTLGLPAKRQLSVAGVPLHLTRRLAMSVLRWAFTFEPSRRFERKTKVWVIAGAIAEYRSLAAQKRVVTPNRECDANSKVVPQ